MSILVREIQKIWVKNIYIYTCTVEREKIIWVCMYGIIGGNLFVTVLGIFLGGGGFKGAIVEAVDGSLIGFGYGFEWRFRIW